MSRKYQWIGVGVTIGAVGVAAAHVTWPGVKIDSIAVALLVVAALPWLGNLLESLELPGGWKMKFQSLEKRQEKVEKRQHAVEQTASDAGRGVQAALGVAQTKDLSTAPPADDIINELVEEYDQKRARNARTAELDRLFGVMVAKMRNVRDFDVAKALQAESEGKRLTGYAYIFGTQDPAWLADVVDSTVREPKSLVQYWGIRTVGVLVDQMGASAVPGWVVGQLRELLDRMPPESTRRGQLAALLQALRRSSDPVTR